MNTLKRQLKSFKQFIAFVVSIVMIFECSGMQVLAETMPVDEENTRKEMPVSIGVGEGVEGTTDGSSDGNDVVAFGIYCEGVTWSLSEEGVLTVTGTASEGLSADKENYTLGWKAHATDIVSAKINAKGVKCFAGFFDECKNMISVDLSEADTKQAINMSEMFRECESLTGLDLSNFDMSNVSDAKDMLLGCAKLKTINTPKNLSATVELCCGYSNNYTYYTELPKNKAESLLLSKWDSVYAQGTYHGMEWTITSDGVLFIQGTVDESLNVDDLGTHWAIYGEGVAGAQLSASGVKQMNHWFKDMSNLRYIFWDNFDTSQVTEMIGMYENCSSLSSGEIDKFNTSNVTNMHRMFYNCSRITGLNLTGFDTSKVTDISQMFGKCSNLESLDLSSFDLSNVQSADRMFEDCVLLETIKTPKNLAIEVKLPDVFKDDEGNQYTILPMNMKESITLYKDIIKVVESGTLCEGVTWTLTNTGVLTIEGTAAENVGSEWDDYDRGWQGHANNILSAKVSAKGIKSLYSFFRGCSNLETIDFTGFDTSQVTDMSCMFMGCNSLKEIDLSMFDTSNVTDMHSMFSNCYNLTSLDVSNFDTSQVKLMNHMFFDCKKLKHLDLGNFDCSELYVSGSNAFALNLFLYGCDSLETVVVPCNISSKIDKQNERECDLPCTMYDSDYREYEHLPTELKEPIVLYRSKELVGSLDGDDKTESGTSDGNDNSSAGDGNDVFHDEVIGEFKVSFVRDHVYTGKAITPKVIVTFGADTLVEGVDYTVSYKNNVNAAAVGSAKAPTIIVKGKGNYDSSETLEFNIHALEMTVKNTSVSEMIFAQNNKEQTVKPVVTVAGKKLKAGKDYTIEYPDKGKVDGAYKNAGTYNILIKGCGNYQGSLSTTMMILGEGQIMASKLKVAKIPAYDYVEGTPATPTPDVMNKKDKLELGKDYAISYINNDRAGKATLVITGLKNTDANGTFVAGTLKKTFIIKGTALKKARAEYNNKVNYTGSAICPEITLAYDGKTLRPGVDYTVKYSNNVNVGKGTILLTGQGGYTGTVKKTFTIQADASIADKLAVNFANGKAEASFDQKGAKPSVSVVLGDVTLKAGKDYTVSYKNNKKLAAANAEKAPVVIIKGKGNYKFTKEVPFAIAEKALTDVDMSIVSADKFVDSKKGYLSAPVVKDGNGKKLKVNKDYKVLGYTVNGAAFEGTGEVAAGTVVTVTVEGMGNYKGQTQITYRIANNDISKVKVNKPQLEYNGGKVTFTEEMLKAGKLELSDKATGKTLVYGTDFVVVGYKNNTKKGNATVTVQGIGEYGGTKAVKFSIVSKKIEKK